MLREMDTALQQRRRASFSGGAEGEFRLARAQQRIGRYSDARETEHRARLLSDPKSYAAELQDRSVAGNHQPTHTRRYIEALHKAYPELAGAFRSYLTLGPEEQAKLKRKAGATSHEPALFLPTVKKMQTGDRRTAGGRHDLHSAHLTALHKLIQPEGWEDSFTAHDSPDVWDHEHEHDAHAWAGSDSRGLLDYSTRLHRSLIKYHYPNAKTLVHKRGWGSDTVSISNPLSLRARGQRHSTR